MIIRIAHSPDTDDHLMFWALRNNVVTDDRFSFSFETFDTESLNQLSRTGKYDVIAISVAAYSAISDRYQILRHGASIGRNYGPVLVSTAEQPLESLTEATVAVPGLTTTAALVIRRVLPQAKLVEIPIEPYGQVFQVLHRGEVDAAVLIHEGQLEYTKHGLVCLLDLGKWWGETTGQPLPLGINVIKRSLGTSTIQTVGNLIKESIRYGIENQSELIDELIKLNVDRNSDATTREQITTYLARYVNQDSLEIDQSVIEAIDHLVHLHG